MSQSPSALLHPQSALCLSLSLIKSLDLAGLIQYFVVIFLKFKFQSLLMGEVPTIICTAQLELHHDTKSALCFISLIHI
jgi:hypothetical protein